MDEIQQTEHFVLPHSYKCSVCTTKIDEIQQTESLQHITPPNLMYKIAAPLHCSSITKPAPSPLFSYNHALIFTSTPSFKQDCLKAKLQPTRLLLCLWPGSRSLRLEWRYKTIKPLSYSPQASCFASGPGGRFPHTGTFPPSTSTSRPGSPLPTSVLAVLLLLSWTARARLPKCAPSTGLLAQGAPVSLNPRLGDRKQQLYRSAYSVHRPRHSGTSLLHLAWISSALLTSAMRQGSHCAASNWPVVLLCERKLWCKTDEVYGLNKGASLEGRSGCPT